MTKTGYAFFIERPRVLDDLIKPHVFGQEKPYEIVKTIRLGAMEFENFVTDMVADRKFIEDYADVCSNNEVWRCLAIQKRGECGAVLVMPLDRCYVGYAAWVPKV